MRQWSVWNLAMKSLSAEIPVMLLYVLESRGSSPGRQGFFLVVNALGEMAGSVGGGIMEHKFVELAKQRLTSEPDSASIHKQIHNKSAAQHQSGMICSGEQTLLLYRLKTTDFSAIERLCKSLCLHQNGTLELSSSGISFDNNIPEKDFHFHIHSETDWLYKEKTGFKNRLYIIGGGHCSLALAELFSRLDFYIQVFDDRQNLNTFESNSYAHMKRLVGNYSELAALIPSHPNAYIVVMTFGYRTDDLAIRALLYKSFGYFGVLGSKSKIKKLFEQYESEGISMEKLSKLHAPAGLPIKSETPEEIALSIAAEVIKVRNSGKDF